jgi:integrase
MPNRKKVEVRILTVKAALKQLKEKSRGEYVFSNPEDSPYKSIRSAFKTACKHAKFTPVTPQALRYTFVSRLAREGI